ncbi:DUF2939 domain-containing protein [Adhaeribacter rhizoryzae]|uniref:DUF2939 domain-containing protein n=1 Tax=Adhaeribacter rhizoryzae TaxID=2607907 RepID=A0A5M6CWS2_9BACT|nr:DUF2939 domain-containing protein [Adhaeribacter rhizoryzae]KAA5539553.1 DUF2939 domain-containing protein [Adhaeribacter rhizoryzae]
MKKVLIIVVLLALVGGFLYYRSFVQSPKYSLLQAHEALQDHDMAEFEKFVNIERVTGSLVDQLAAHQSLLSALNPGSLVTKQVLRFMKPQLAQVAGNEIQKYVETGDFKKDPNAPRKKVDISLSGLWHKVVSDSAAFKGVKYVNEQGEIALVGLEFTQPRYDTTLVLEVKMEDKGDYWQVTELANTGELLKHTSRLQKQRLASKLHLR